MIGPLSAIAGMMMVGLVIITPVLFIGGIPEKPNATNAIWLIVGGLGNLCGLLLAYAAFRIGKVGVVAPILCPSKMSSPLKPHSSPRPAPSRQRASGL